MKHKLYEFDGKFYRLSEVPPNRRVCNNCAFGSGNCGTYAGNGAMNYCITSESRGWSFNFKRHITATEVVQSLTTRGYII